MYKLYTHPKYSYVQIVVIPFTSIDKIDFALCNQPTETPDAYYKRQIVKPDIITNGGFYTLSNGITCFSFIDEGKVIEGSSFDGMGIRGNKTLFYSKPSGTYRDFIAAYPPLVVEGQRYKINYAKELDYNARRTCIGWNKENYYIVVVDKPGLAYRALQDIFLELEVDYAINLDGGGSTRLLVDGKRKTAESYARPVDNVMCIYLQKEQSQETDQKTIYRVQIGAFCSKVYAEQFLADVQKKGYPDAYIKKVGLYYKVQVGAFYVKLNAERLKDQLIAQGYDAFITINKE